MNRFAALPPLGPHVRTIVAIPARDEALGVVGALEALDRQVTLLGERLDPDRYETIVFANGCTDGTAAIARSYAASRRRGAAHAIHVVEAKLGPDAHVGTARRLVMDAAFARFRAAGSLDGWIASTDADSAVSRRWICELDVEAARGAEAVMGRVCVAPRDRAAFTPDAARSYAYHLAYDREIARLEAAIDPVDHDPAPRHRMRFAASLAVRADVYGRAGGLPELPRGEDAALFRALVRNDARVRHSLRFLAATSPRSVGRVEGGFATLVRSLHDATGPAQWLVEHPDATQRRIRARAALRAYHRSGDSASAAYREVLEHFDLDFATFARLYAPLETFGRNLQRLEANAEERGSFTVYVRVPVARAIAELRDAGAACSRSAIRTSVASGAG